MEQPEIKALLEPDLVEVAQSSDAAARALRDARHPQAFGATVALDGVDLRWPPARSAASSARTAPGKSTLMAILAGALLPDAGEMSLDGERRMRRAARSTRAAPASR